MRSVTGPITAKRICFITTLFVTLDTFLRRQAEVLVEDGWEVTWVSAPRGVEDSLPPRGVRHIDLPIVRGVSIRGSWSAFLDLVKLFRRERFDIVQYSTPNASFCASLAARLMRQPNRVYAQWGIRYVGLYGISRWVFKAVERVTCACSTQVQPDSSGNLSFAVSEGLYSPPRASIIWNGSACGVDLERFNLAHRAEWRLSRHSEFALDETHTVIGFVGGICKDKGCNELLTAARSLFESHPKTRLMLVGPRGQDHTLDPALREWAIASDMVIWVPSTSCVEKYLACMDIFAFPSYREGFGMAVVEAEAMGLPVVVTAIPGPTEAMLDGQTGLVVPVKDVQALTESLRLLVLDVPYRDRLGMAGPAFVREHFEQGRFMALLREDKARILQKGVQNA